MGLYEEEVQRRPKIHVHDDFSANRFSWSPNHVRDFENPISAIQIARLIMEYLFEEPDCEETDGFGGSGKRFLLKSAIAKCEDMKRQRSKYQTEQGEV